MEKSTVKESDTNKVTSPILESNSPGLLPDLKGNNEFEKEEGHKDKESDVSTNQDKIKNDKISKENGTNSIVSTNGNTGPQIFVVRPLPSRINQNSNIQDPSTSSEKNRVNNHLKSAQLRSIRGMLLFLIYLNFLASNIPLLQTHDKVFLILI